MVTLVDAWNSYLLLLNSLKKSAATKKQYNIDGQQLLVFAHDNNYLYVDHHLKELLFVYSNYLKETYTNINTFNHKIATLRGFVDLALTLLTTKQLMQIANVWSTYFQYAKTMEHAWLARRNGCIVQILMETGCKPAELVRMKWSHINFDSSVIYISNHNGRREIKLSPILMNMLMNYKEATEELHKENLGEWVWVSDASQSKSISTKTIERIFQIISKEISTNVRATDLRYTVMQKAFQSEKTIENIQEKMGYVRKWVLTERQGRFE